MTDRKRHIGSVVVVCLAFCFLLAPAGRTLTQPVKPVSPSVHRDLGHIPPPKPLLLPARAERTPYDRPACRLACEQVGFWEMERELTLRLVNACKIGCNLGQDHCL